MNFGWKSVRIHLKTRKQDCRKSSIWKYKNENYTPKFFWKTWNGGRGIGDWVCRGKIG